MATEQRERERERRREVSVCRAERRVGAHTVGVGPQQASKSKRRRRKKPRGSSIDWRPLWRLPDDPGPAQSSHQGEQMHRGHGGTKISRVPADGEGRKET